MKLPKLVLTNQRNAVRFEWDGRDLWLSPPQMDSLAEQWQALKHEIEREGRLL